jgi:hypothetical protein
MQICTVPTVLTARRHLAATRYDEVAQWLSATNTVETPMRVNTAEVALVNVRAQPQRCPHSYSTISVAHYMPLALKVPATLPIR